jgi:hypothetical protein
MQSKAVSRRYAGIGAVALALLCAVAPAASADNKPEVTGIFTCVDDKGRKLTSDRLIPECNGKEQRELNKDGSLKRIIPPTLTPEERAETEARERNEAERRAATNDARRRDQNLKARYRNEEAHQRAREAALDTVRMAMRASEQRLKDLSAERKPLLDEAEFFKGRLMPLKLKQALDANDAGTEAQKSAMANQEAELVRINRLFDAELDRLRRLWAGAQPGTLGGALAAAALSASAPKR